MLLRDNTEYQGTMGQKDQEQKIEHTNDDQNEFKEIARLLENTPVRPSRIKEMVDLQLNDS